MNFLRKKIVSDVQLFENPLHFQNQISSASALLCKVLEVHRVVEEESHLDLVHIFNLLHHDVVIWMPVLGVSLQEPAVSRKIKYWISKVANQMLQIAMIK